MLTIKSIFLMNFSGFIINIFLLLCVPEISYSQSCGSPSSAFGNGCIAPWPTSNAEGPFFIKVKFHKLAGESGEEVLDQHIEESKNILNNTFNSLNIFFNYDCENVCHYFELEYDAESITFTNVCEVTSNSVPGYLNIFIGSEFATQLFLAKSIPGDWLIVSGSDQRSGINIPGYNSNILVHEVGHCLGLHHTHFGNEAVPTIDPCSPNEVFGCPDNSTINNICDPTQLTQTECGDCICDTPADPKLVYNSNFYLSAGGDCIYNGSSEFTPSMTNVMSYTLVSCLQGFTEKQVRKMKDFLSSNFSSIIIYNEVGSNIIITNPFAVWPQNNSYYNRKVIIENGGFLRIENKDIVASPNLEFQIKAGGKLKISNTSLSSCEKLWVGITVESGGELIIDSESNIACAHTAVKIEPNGTSSIKNSNFDNCYIGIELKEQANLGIFENIIIQTSSEVLPTILSAPYWSKNTYCGILLGKKATMKIGDNGIVNVFKNINLGIFANEASSVVCSNAKFENIERRLPWVPQMGRAIYLYKNNYNLISNNEVQDCNEGIFAYDSYFQCIDNFINTDEIAISSANNKGKYNIVKDNEIASCYKGIDLYFNGTSYVKDNDIYAQRQKSTDFPAVGIDVKGFSRNDILGNSVHFLAQQDNQVGIMSVLGSNYILDNYVEALYTPNQSQKGIALLGGNRADVNCNIVFNYLTGAFLDNSTGNTISCNSFSSQEKDLQISNNAIFQNLTANSFSSGNTNLVLESPIGIQKEANGAHHGNKWYSMATLGADATDLDLSEVNFSTIYFDKVKSDNEDKKWYPKSGGGTINSDPTSLFNPEAESVPTLACTGCVEGDFFQWFSSNPSPEQLCNWLKNIQSKLSPKRTFWWKKYIYRLIKKWGIPKEQLSQCLKDIIIEIEGKKQFNVENVRNNLEALSRLSNTPVIQAKYDDINLYLEDTGRNSNFDQAVFDDKIIDLNNSIDGLDVQITELRSNVNSDLALIVTDSDYTEEHLLYSTLADYMFDGTLPQNRLALDNYAANCSEESGENVFLAKSLLSLLEKVDPFSPSCNAEFRSKKDESKKLVYDINISPNLSSGVYQVLYSNNATEYDFEIFNSNGKLVKNTSGTHYRIDISNENTGLYFIIFRNKSENKIITKKVMKI
ncbi:MAG: T9SS type A sorting domain-containing protein [Saprospiraceae bacterium]|nr:T9SS type A sorting domain-containing protein [Saprospiraceae bacterium]